MWDIMTVFQLKLAATRLDEIVSQLDVVHCESQEFYDLNIEFDEIIAKLEKSLAQAELKEAGFFIVPHSGTA